MGRDNLLSGDALKLLNKRDIHISAHFGTGGFEPISWVVILRSIVKMYHKLVFTVLALDIHQLTGYRPD
jgi:hypothetical protein